MVLLSTSYDHNLTFSKSQATRQTTQTQQIGLEKKTEEKVEKFTVRAGKISGPTVRGYTLRPPKKHVEERLPRVRQRSPRLSTCQPLDGQPRSRETPTPYLQNPQVNSLSLILRMFLSFSLSPSLPRARQLRSPRHEHRSYCFSSFIANLSW
jgi:hypothetical protein